MDTNLVLALSGADRLTPEVLLASASAHGARTVQLNVSDEAVAAGLRLTHLDPPVEAFVTATGERLDGTGLCAAVGEHVGTVRGWWVETAEPLPPRTVADGERLDALANVAVLRRPADRTEEEWVAFWKDHHTAVAIETQGTFGYVQHRVLEALPGSPQVAAIVEEHFPTAALSDVHAFYGSGGDDAELGRRLERLMDSVARLGADRDLDLVPTSRYRWSVDPEGAGASA
jgi:hypothetical protein